MWALNYAIQRCFGWQNSHLHNFVLPEKQFAALTDRQTKQYVMLIGLVFRSPWMKEEEFWADDYEDGSFKTWLKSKYTAPYKSLCYGEGLHQCKNDAFRIEHEYYYCRVKRTHYDNGHDFYGPMEKISEAEYRKLKSVAPLKTERKTKMATEKSRIKRPVNLRICLLIRFSGLIHLLPCVLCLRDFRLVMYFAHRKAV